MLLLGNFSILCNMAAFGHTLPSGVQEQHYALMQEMISKIESAKRFERSMERKDMIRYDTIILHEVVDQLGILQKECKRNKSLLDFISKQNFAMSLLQIASINHKIAGACVSLLALVVQTEDGFFLIKQREDLISKLRKDWIVSQAHPFLTAYDNMQRTHSVIVFSRYHPGIKGGNLVFR
jgi:hypothetical protein